MSAERRSSFRGLIALVVLSGLSVALLPAPADAGGGAPVARYGTYLGGSAFDWAWAVAVDQDGNRYLAGVTDSPDLPGAAGSVGSSRPGSRDGFVAKIASDGHLIYATYIGGSGWDNVYGLAVDADGDAFVTGSTGSPDFPTTPGAFQRTLQGTTNAYVAEIDPTGSRFVYSTYLGGTTAFPNAVISPCCKQVAQSDIGVGIAVDPAGHAWVTGSTDSIDFPITPDAAQRVYRGGGTDVFVTELDPTGSGVLYSTYLGGAGTEYASSIELDAAGATYVSGSTGSFDFPTTPGAFQPVFNPAPPPVGTPSFGVQLRTSDAFVTKIVRTGPGVGGSSLAYSTYLGGSGNDSGDDLAVDAAGHAFVVGDTNSGDFPTTTGAFQPSPRGILDGFVTELDPDGSGLVYSTYFGGQNAEWIFGVAVGPDGDAYLTGETYSNTDFPITPGAFQPTYPGRGSGQNGDDAAFVARLDPTGHSIVWSSYLGGSTDPDATLGYTNIAYGIALGPSGDVVVAGVTTSRDFPLAGYPAQDHLADAADIPAYGLRGDAFLTVIGQ
ncbi:MAG: SBBP repeat-containing protein, partial [Actinomycetota bacterium]